MLDRYVPIIILIFLFVSMGVHFVNNSSSGVLGKDESLYIFLAKGHSDNTPISAPTGSWMDAIEKGVQRTSDPPSIFLLLLHFWEKISFSEIWLRFLPYIFFAVSVITVIKTGLLLRLPFFFSVCLGFLPLASSGMASHSFEIRAYGMEICLTYIMIYAALKMLIKINKNISPDKSDWIIFSLVVIAGLSSRFSFVISSGAMYGVLWLAIMISMKYPYFKRNLISLAISSIVFLVFFSICLGMSLLSTNNPLNSFSPEHNMYTIPGTFIDVLGYLVKQILLIPLALFGGSGIRGTPFMYIVIILLLCIASIGLINAYNFIKNGGITKMRKDLILYFGVFLFPLLALLISGFLAATGAHPFAVTSKWSIYLQPSFHLFIMGLALLFTSQTGNSLEKGHIVLNKLYRVSFTFIVAIISIIYGSLYLSYNLTSRMGGPQETVRVISNAITDNELKNIDYWYISVGEANSFKYHVLYGGLKDKLSPKAKIIIENRPAGVKEVSCSELEKIYNEAKDNNKIVMVLGHVNKKEAEVYVEIFEKYFPNAKYGEYETTSSEQVLFAVR